MGALRWRGSFLVTVGFALLWLALGARVPLGHSWAQSSADPALTLTPALPLVGTYGCSARACHGGLEPLRGSSVLQNEHTTWILHDKHADAYRVLFNERSQTIARNLGGKPAHEDVRCLACHTHPLTAPIAERIPPSKRDSRGLAASRVMVRPRTGSNRTRDRIGNSFLQTRSEPRA
jgi:hypothetical protein